MRAAFLVAAMDLAASAPPEAEGAGAPLALLEAARPVAERHGDPERGARLEHQLAVLHWREGDLAEADAVLDGALERYSGAWGYWPELAVLAAEVAARLGDANGALALLERAEGRLLDRASAGGDEPPDYVRTHHRSLRSKLYGVRGQVWRGLGVWEEASRWLEAERDQAVETGVLENWAAYLIHAADLDLATRAFEPLLERSDEVLSAPYGSAFAPEVRAQLRGYRAMALFELERHEPDRPARAEEALRAVVEDPALTAVDRLSFALPLADVLHRRGALDECARVLADGRRLVEELGAGTAGGVPLHEAAVLAALESRLALARGALDAELATASGRLRAAYRRMLEQWERTPPRPGGIGFLHLGTRRFVLGELLRAAVRAGEAAGDRPAGVERAVAHLVEAQARGTIARTRDVAPLTVADIRARLLPEHGGALLLLPARDRSHLVALDRTTLHHEELPSAREISAAWEPLRLELLRPLTGGAAAAERLAALAERPAEVLLSPALRALLERWEAVRVVGGDLAGQAPLECLPLGDGTLLGERVAVSHLPSFPLGEILRRRPRPEGDGVLFVAATEPAPDLRERWPHLVPLDVPRRRLGSLLSPFERAELVSGADATRAALLGRDHGGVALLHVLAHGLFDARRERGAGLALAPGDGGGVLRCEDAEVLRGVRGLVVLSACGAALGPERQGDDRLAHLGGAFLDAGARCVVVSRARLELEPTLELMEVFHRRLARPGASAAEALRAARAELAREGDGAARFHHAQVQVVGLGHEPVWTAPPRPAGADDGAAEVGGRTLAVGLAAAAAAATVLVRRARRRARAGR